MNYLVLPLMILFTINSFAAKDCCEWDLSDLREQTLQTYIDDRYLAVDMSQSRFANKSEIKQYIENEVRDDFRNNGYQFLRMRDPKQFQGEQAFFIAEVSARANPMGGYKVLDLKEISYSLDELFELRVSREEIQAMYAKSLLEQEETWSQRGTAAVHYMNSLAILREKDTNPGTDKTCQLSVSKEDEVVIHGYLGGWAHPSRKMVNFDLAFKEIDETSPLEGLFDPCVEAGFCRAISGGMDWFVEDFAGASSAENSYESVSTLYSAGLEKEQSLCWFIKGATLVYTGFRSEVEVNNPIQQLTAKQIRKLNKKIKKAKRKVKKAERRVAKREKKLQKIETKLKEANAVREAAIKAELDREIKRADKRIAKLKKKQNKAQYKLDLANQKLKLANEALESLTK